MNKIKKGRFGEEVATKYLRNKGHRILANNFRIKSGEIDIITDYDHTIYFCEVKYWQDSQYKKPIAIFTKNKRDRMRAVAEVFLSQNKDLLNHYVSFALVEIHSESTIYFYTDLF